MAGRRLIVLAIVDLLVPGVRCIARSALKGGGVGGVAAETGPRKRGRGNRISCRFS